MSSVLTTVFAAFSLALAFVSISFIIPTLKGAPWVPSPNPVIRRMLVLSKVKPGEELYDLGSGDGRVVVMSAREFGARSIGIEIDPFRALYSKLVIRLLGLRGRARVIWSSFNRIDLSGADVVIMYLLQETNDGLKARLERELKPTCRVVSRVFKFDWKLVDADEEARVYVYHPRPAATCFQSRDEGGTRFG